MENKKEYTCCFFGHRQLAVTDALREKINQEIEALILNKNVTSFLFGSKSRFDELCLNVVSRLKEKHRQIERTYVRAEFPFINEEYKKYLQKFYEHTYYPSGIQNAGKAVYIKRNFEMIDKSDFCIFYYDKNCNLSSGGKSGTKIAFDYANRKCRTIINVFCPKTDETSLSLLPPKNK